MKKYFLMAVIAAVAVFAGFGCKSADTPSPLNVIEQYNLEVENNMTKVTYYVSPDGPEDKLKYCNGSEMDSAAYKVTLSKKVTVTAPGELTGDLLINRTLNLAAQAAKFSPNLAETEDFVKVSNGVAQISPVEGWAGVSIYLCAWKPFVEKQLEQFSEIKRIEWTSGAPN